MNQLTNAMANIRPLLAAALGLALAFTLSCSSDDDGGGGVGGGGGSSSSSYPKNLYCYRDAVGKSFCLFSEIPNSAEESNMREECSLISGTVADSKPSKCEELRNRGPFCVISDPIMPECMPIGMFQVPTECSSLYNGKVQNTCPAGYENIGGEGSSSSGGRNNSSSSSGGIGGGSYPKIMSCYRNTVGKSFCISYEVFDSDDESDEREWCSIISGTLANGIPSNCEELANRGPFCVVPNYCISIGLFYDESDCDEYGGTIQSTCDYIGGESSSSSGGSIGGGSYPKTMSCYRDAVGKSFCESDDIFDSDEESDAREWCSSISGTMVNGIPSNCEELRNRGPFCVMPDYTLCLHIWRLDDESECDEYDGTIRNTCPAGYEKW